MRLAPTTKRVSRLSGRRPQHPVWHTTKPPIPKTRQELNSTISTDAAWVGRWVCFFDIRSFLKFCHFIQMTFGLRVETCLRCSYNPTYSYCSQTGLLLSILWCFISQLGWHKARLSGLLIVLCFSFSLFVLTVRICHIYLLKATWLDSTWFYPDNIWVKT